jgi:sulfate permease, SulP family
VFCNARLEHFLRAAQRSGLVVLLAGLRPDFLEVLKRLRFTAWYPAERFFPEEDENWSATLRAVRVAYTRLGESNTCPHCSERVDSARNRDLYYLV